MSFVFFVLVDLGFSLCFVGCVCVFFFPSCSVPLFFLFCAFGFGFVCCRVWVFRCSVCVL